MTADCVRSYLVLPFCWDEYECSYLLLVPTLLDPLFYGGVFCAVVLTTYDQ